MKTKAVFGPPGTGKTWYLMEVVKKLQQSDTPTLFLSYTRAAAQEVVSRLPEGSDCIRPSTMHSFAFNTLGMTRSTVVDRKKLAAFGLVTGIPFKGSEEGSDDLQEGDEFLSALQYANNRMIPEHDAWDMFGRPGTMDRWNVFLKSYREWKSTYGYMDFDDMLRSMLRIETTMGHRAIVLDEAQDCSPLQWSVFKKLCHADVKWVWVAGDDDQAIYEWNGADPHGMADFAEDGVIETLKRSHRVPRAAHQLSISLSGQISKRQSKPYIARGGSYGEVIRYGDILNFDMSAFDNGGGGMILVRDRFKLDEIRRSLNRDMIPYTVLGGASPWTSKIAQQLRDGGKPDIPGAWRVFYKQADLTRPVQITLSTIHQAKGREAPRVVVDLTMPQRALADLHKNPDAELRVWYVALTRTSDELSLCGSNPLL